MRLCIDYNRFADLQTTQYLVHQATVSARRSTTSCSRYCRLQAVRVRRITRAIERCALAARDLAASSPTVCCPERASAARQRCRDSRTVVVVVNETQITCWDDAPMIVEACLPPWTRATCPFMLIAVISSCYMRWCLYRLMAQVTMAQKSGAVLSCPVPLLSVASSSSYASSASAPCAQVPACSQSL